MKIRQSTREIHVYLQANNFSHLDSAQFKYNFAGVAENLRVKPRASNWQWRESLRAQMRKS
jgi:hypothetical protein